MFDPVRSSYSDAATSEAVEAANKAIEAYRAETLAIEAAAGALVEEAMRSAPDDAPRLCKAVEALRLRRVRNLLSALRVPEAKIAARNAIRAAAALEVASLTERLERHEGTLREAAEALGYAVGTRQRITLFSQDPTRRDLNLALAAARANQVFSIASEADGAEVEEVKRRLATLLK